MDSNKSISSGTLKLGGISGIIILFFLVGVAFQQVSGWFPENALQYNEMREWLTTVSSNSTMAYVGIGISLFCIIFFMPFGWTVYKLLPADSWISTAAFSIYAIGSSLSLAAFTFGFGFTWALIDLVQSSTGYDPDNLSALATMGMRGFLWADDLATGIIGLGHILFSIESFRSKRLPNWLCVWGIIGGLLVILVVFRYLSPFFTFAVIGYLIFTLWWFLTGIILLKKGKDINP